METLELREAKAAQQVSGRAGPGTQMSQLPVQCPVLCPALLALWVTSSMRRAMLRLKLAWVSSDSSFWSGKYSHSFPVEPATVVSVGLLDPFYFPPLC